MAFLIYTFALALLSALALSSNTEPNCEELIKPLELDGNYNSSGVSSYDDLTIEEWRHDYIYQGWSQIMGKWILDEGASEGIVGMIIQTMETHWMELLPGTNNDTVLVRQAYRLDNTCRSETMEIPLNAFNEPASNAAIQYYLLPSCSNCLTGYFHQDNKDYPTRVLLLFSRERQVSDSVRELYHKQVKCLGFPYYITSYNDESELC